MPRLGVCGQFYGSRLFTLESRSAGPHSERALQGFWRGLVLDNPDAAEALQHPALKPLLEQAAD
jgi:hypothetical protein